MNLSKTPSSWAYPALRCIHAAEVEVARQLCRDAVDTMTANTLRTTEISAGQNHKVNFSCLMNDK